MKKTIISITFFSLFISGLLVCCKKDTTNPFGGEKGQVTFYTESDLGVGNITVTVDGSEVGTMSHFFSGGVDCGSGDVNVVKDAGTYNWSATSQSGGSWTGGTVTFIKGKCQTLPLTTGSNVLAGNPGNPRFNLQFTNPDNVDLDLYVITPNGNTIYYRNTSADNGTLDVDCKCSSCPQGPNENIYWVNGTAPRGTYQVYVKYYDKCSGSSTYQSSTYTLRILNQNTVIQAFTGSLSSKDQKSTTHNFTF